MSACFLGMGASVAQLHRAGFKVISWREFECLEILCSKVDPKHVINPEAKDFEEHPWYIGYFKGGGDQGE